jgi:hypothetical protein
MRYLSDIKNLVQAVETVISGRLSHKLLAPLELHLILDSVGHHLHSGLSLVTGTRMEDRPTYYEVARVRAVATETEIQIVGKALGSRCSARWKARGDAGGRAVQLTLRSG